MQNNNNHSNNNNNFELLFSDCSPQTRYWISNMVNATEEMAFGIYKDDIVKEWERKKEYF